MKCRDSVRPALPGLVIFGLALGCGDLVPSDIGAEPSGAGSSEFAFEAEEGTCDGWKVRYCEAFVQCGHGTLDECVYEAEFVKCRDDSPYVDCERQFKRVVNREDCSLFPGDCYPRDIADRSEARELCEAVQEAACEYDLYCGYSFNLDRCVTETTQIYDCSGRLSAVPGADACVKELRRAACGDPLPEVCADHTRF